MEILELYEINHVGDMSFKVDFGACEVHSFAQASEGDGIGIVSLLSESAVCRGLPHSCTNSRCGAKYQGAHCQVRNKSDQKVPEEMGTDR